MAAEKIEKGTFKLVGKELRKVLMSGKGHLQAFLLSLLQKEEDLPAKEIGPRKGSKERAKGKVPSSVEEMHEPKAPETAGPGDQQAETRSAVRKPGPSLETDDEEIDAEADPRKAQSSSPTPTPSKRNASTAAGENVAANVEAGPQTVSGRATEKPPTGPVPTVRLPNSPPVQSRARQASAAVDGAGTASPSRDTTSPARKEGTPQRSRERPPLSPGVGVERRMSPRSKGPAQQPASPTPSRSSSKRTPLKKGDGKTGPKERGGFNRKEALSKMSPTSRKQIMKKQCEDCDTWNGIRAKKCSNEECGVELGNKAAEKRAAALQKKLATRTSDERAQARNAARGPATNASAEPVGNGVSHSGQTLESVVYSLDQISDANKKEMMSCLEKEEFDLQTAKETTATEFKVEFPDIPFARWKALEARLSKL
ncbi:hypothetical protein KFL_008780010 [Klebsormidium nitens]|uniref:Uncharacterized protein n=1 Tax=Klebsormidium nitens TaxID=105231 RepID=A0A1Y1IUJ0_KLENI|nr:hypothetical protein KFL_008780010 [Klebsormidium nitens]|eukprot:GAQ91898.1 hypothetical protein KFL_008780010 [Klebsormidium nitens]